jgi:hypothetical protein
MLQFMFETGETSPSHYHTYVFAKSESEIDYAALEDSITSFIESNYEDGLENDDMEFDYIVKAIMDNSGHEWVEDMPFPVTIDAMYTFWV